MTVTADKTTGATPADQRQRLLAIDPMRCVCVTAPAGAGKTELLSQRVLTLLSGVEQPEEILAITFTRKAAAEMRHRIIQALQMAQTEQPQQAHKRLSQELAKKALARDQHCNWQLLANPNRLNIQTIDSLCASLTRQMPILANFGAQPQIADNAAQHYRSAVYHFLARLESDSPIADDLSRLLMHVDNDMAKIERLLVALLQRRDQWLLHIGMGGQSDVARQRLEQTLTQLREDVLHQLHTTLQPVAADLLPLLDYAGCNLQREKCQSPITALAGVTELPPTDTTAVEHWLAIAEMLLTKNNQWRKTVNKNTGFPAQTHEGDKALAKQRKDSFSALLAQLSQNDSLLDSLQELRHLPTACYDSEQWALLEALTRLLPALVAQLTLEFQQHAQVDYSQISIAALQALGSGLNPSELALKLDHQLRHILIDEFQDTASTQFTLLERLVEGWQEHNDNNPDCPNTVFIVGDGMQSIYGFREANVGLFLGARKHGINGLQLDNLPLTVNFRSSPAVVDWVNATFERAFPAVENLARGAVPFEQARAFKPAAKGSTVQVFGFTAEQANRQEADKTVALVEATMQQNPGASIAILVRSRSHLRDIIVALSRAGLRWQATDINPLSDTAAVIDLLSLTRALLNSADRISWAALLRTPWIGLTNRDLHTLLAQYSEGADPLQQRRMYPQSVWSALNDNTRIERLSRHGRERLPAVRTILQAALANRQRLPVRSWIEGVWLQLGGAGSLNTTEELDAVDDYFDLLEHYQRDGALAFNEFEQAVQHLYSAPSGQDSPLHIMTIHKAKGLEFDTVILPGMARKARSDDKSLLMWREYLPRQAGEAGLIISPSGASGSDEDRIYQHLRYEQAQSAMLENTRLLYVATTRAVNQLYLLFTAQYDKKRDEIIAPPKSSLLSSTWPALKDSVIWQAEPRSDNAQMGLDFDTAPNRVSLQRLPADWRAPDWHFINPLADYYLNADQHNGDEANRPALAPDLLARSTGTVTHRILEQLVHSGCQFWSAMPEQQRQRWLQALLHHDGLATSLWPQAITLIRQAIDNTVNDKKGQWILSSSHPHSVCEWELLACFPAAVKQKIIDRSFIDADGVRWIVDYKTGQPHENESRQDFIERETAAHRKQLAGYASYLAMLEHQRARTQTIKTALYFTYYPHWQELTV